MPTKSELRRRFRGMRRKMSASAIEDASRHIVAAVRGMHEFAGARVLHSYWPSLSQHEVDVRPLIHDVIARGGRVLLPVVTAFGPPAGRPRLENVEYTRGTELKPNRWGILEPAGPPVPVDAVDLTLVPALACDLEGHRLGHGLGYYDELLAGMPGIRMGICLDACVVEDIAAEPHDQRVDIVVTERRIIRTPDRNAA